MSRVLGVCKIVYVIYSTQTIIFRLCFVVLNVFICMLRPTFTKYVYNVYVICIKICFLKISKIKSNSKNFRIHIPLKHFTRWFWTGK